MTAKQKGSNQLPSLKTRLEMSTKSPPPLEAVIEPHYQASTLTFPETSLALKGYMSIGEGCFIKSYHKVR